jgi:hypothetical protein
VKRVLVVINKVLFRVGLESLLSQQKEWDLKTIVYQNDNTLVAAIKDFQPEVILVDEGVQIKDLPNVLGIFSDFPEIRLLVVNSQENRIQVYDKREIPISRPEDLFNAVKN